MGNTFNRLREALEEGEPYHFYRLTKEDVGKLKVLSRSLESISSRVSGGNDLPKEELDNVIKKLQILSDNAGKFSAEEEVTEEYG